MITAAVVIGVLVAYAAWATKEMREWRAAALALYAALEDEDEEPEQARRCRSAATARGRQRCENA